MATSSGRPDMLYLSQLATSEIWMHWRLHMKDVKILEDERKLLALRFN